MSKHKYNETMEMLKAVDKVRMCQAMADIERVRLGGYTVDLAGGYHDNKKVRRVEARVIVKKDPTKKRIKGTYGLVDQTRPGHWDLEFVKRVLALEDKAPERKRMYKSPMIRLSDRAWNEANRYAKAVYEIVDKLPKGMDLTGNSHYIGARGEQGAREHLGLSMRMDWDGIGRGDAGYDLVYEGQRIDVKSTEYRPGNFMICNDHWKPGKCDILLHASVQGRTVELAGWMWERDFAKQCESGSAFPMLNLTPDCKVIGTGRLNTMEGFRDAIRDGYPDGDAANLHVQMPYWLFE